MGHKALAKIQMGQEATSGTAEAADTIWRGPFAGLHELRETQMVEEQLGAPLKSSRKFGAMKGAEISFPVTPLTPEQSPHVFEAGIKQVNSGTADGDSTSGYTYTYDFGTSAINTISTYTIETGDESQAEEAEYCFVKSITISAVKGEAVQISSEWMGRQVTDASFTGALSAPSVSELAVNSGVLYIDDPASGFGSSQIAAGNIMEVSIEITTGRVALFTADSGNLYFVEAYFNYDEFELAAELKWIHDSALVAEKAKWRNDDDRFVRVEFTGDAYSDPGTTTALGGVKGIQIDMPVSYEDISAIEFDEGKSVVTAQMTGGYENSQDAGLSILVANELAAIP